MSSKPLYKRGGHARHDLGAPSEDNRRYLFIALGLIVFFSIFEVSVAALSGSLVLFSDAGHMLTDVGALVAALWVNYLAARPTTNRWSFGLKRAETLAAAINGIVLLVVALLLAFEAIHRLIENSPVKGLALVIVAPVGVFVNLAATFALGRANRSSLNIRGVVAHVLTDLYAFLGTAAAGALILGFGFRRADPIASLLVVVLMLRSAWSLLAASGHVLLEGTPQSIDLDEVRRHLSELPEVLGVHDVHAWTLSSELPMLSAHIVVTDACLLDGSVGQVLDRLQDCLAGHFDLEHSTFQLEPATHVRHERTAHP